MLKLLFVLACAEQTGSWSDWSAPNCETALKTRTRNCNGCEGGTESVHDKRCDELAIVGPVIVGCVGVVIVAFFSLLLVRRVYLAKMKLKAKIAATAIRHRNDDEDTEPNSIEEKVTTKHLVPDNKEKVTTGKEKTKPHVFAKNLSPTFQDYLRQKLESKKEHRAKAEVVVQHESGYSVLDIRAPTVPQPLSEIREEELIEHSSPYDDDFFALPSAPAFKKKRKRRPKDSPTSPKTTNKEAAKSRAGDKALNSPRNSPDSPKYSPSSPRVNCDTFN